ncbi:enoyl-CoA delta isomerase 1, mitochondrial-like isoform X1 [Apostichopus japonicus]|uniref:enoyl-CoA delta isomerase 1, mitochondrial-like isoform X1 n=1 Tax=Stichopus japonicus TaxID=307972 RepID=UPI003AB3B67E
MAFCRQTVRLFLPGNRYTCIKRYISNQSKYLTVKKDEEFDDVVILKMVKEPDNSICTNLLEVLSETLQQLEDSKSYRAIVLTSGVTGIFSSGLDMLSLRQKPSNEIYKFWSLYQETWVRLYASSLITVAAINGSATASGCALATACDSRVMAEGDHVIGHDETRTGWLVPNWVKFGMVNLIGFKETERSFQKGTIFSPEDAQKIGLVDMVVPKDDLMTSVRIRLKESASLEDDLRISTKNMMRRETTENLNHRQQEDVTNMTIYSLLEHVQESIVDTNAQYLGWKPVPWPSG